MKMRGVKLALCRGVSINGKDFSATEIKSYSSTEFSSKCVYKNGMRLQKQFKGGGQSAQRFLLIGKEYVKCKQ